MTTKVHDRILRLALGGLVLLVVGCMIGLAIVGSYCGRRESNVCLKTARSILVGDSREVVHARLAHAFVLVSASPTREVYLCRQRHVRGICSCIPVKTLRVTATFHANSVSELSFGDDAMEVDHSQAPEAGRVAPARK